MPRGGKRPGSGRKTYKERIEIAHKLAQERFGKDQLPDVAGDVLASINTPAKWRRLLHCGDPRVEADVLKYLTNRTHGMPKQSVDTNVQGQVMLQVVTGVPLITSESQDNDDETVQ